MPVSVVLMIAKAEIDAQHGRCVVTRCNVDWRCYDDRSGVDDHRRWLDVDRSRRYNGRNRNCWSSCDGVDGRRSVGDFVDVDGSRLKGVRENMNSGDAGEHFADRGPFLIAGECGLHAGNGHRGETQNCDSFFHIFVFH